MKKTIREKGYAIIYKGEVRGFYTNFEHAIADLKNARYYLGFQDTDMVEGVRVTEITALKDIDLRSVEYEVSKASLIPQLKADGRI